MLTMTDLMKRTVVTDAHRFPVTEVFFREKTGQIRFVALHTGDAFDHDDTLVSIGRFSPLQDGDWKVWLPEKDIREAPGWDSGEAHPHRVPLPLEAWPPILIGPFGGTTSPLMFYAAMLEAEEANEPPEPPHHSVDPRVDRLERVTHRLGAEAFGADGPLGRLEDFIVAPVAFTITDFVVGGRRIPYTRLRHMSDEGEHTVLNLDRAAFEALPKHGT